MAIAYHNLGRSYLHKDEFTALMKAYEGYYSGVYDDGAQIATIGIGINLKVRNWLARTLQELGVFASNDAYEANRRTNEGLPQETLAEKNTRYGNIVDAFTRIIKSNTLSRNPKTEAPCTSPSEIALQNALDLELRKPKYLNSTTATFTLNENVQSVNIKNAIVLGFTIGPISVKGMQYYLDNKLQQSNVTINHDTVEYKVLMSRFYNGGTGLVTKSLCDAFKLSRAEVWYWMRYTGITAKGVEKPGLVKRRFCESELFGLYNNGQQSVSTDEAKEVFQMLQKHRNDIFLKESKYGVGGARDCVALANNDYRNVIPLIDDGKVNSLIENLNPAKFILMADIYTRYETNTDITSRLTNNIIATNIYMSMPTGSVLDALSVENKYYPGVGADDLMVGMDQNDHMFGQKGNDLLLGEDGNDYLEGGDGYDVIHGGKGNDTIYGGADSDTLYGGEGNDTYYVLSSDSGIDRIEDKLGINRIFFCGKEIKFFYMVGSYFVNHDGTLKAEWVGSNGDFKVTDNATGTQVILNEDFQWGDFGINLIDKPVNPVTTNTIYDYYGEYNTSDLIIGGAGDDYIEGWSWLDIASADWLMGGDGNDTLCYLWDTENSITATSLYVVEGNAGSDMIYGGRAYGNGYCDTKLFGDDYGEMSDLIAAGEIALSINERGDVINGWWRTDNIYGSNRNDALFGNEGKDLIVGGGGDDAIFGDDETSGIYSDWSFTIDSSGVTFVRMGFQKNTIGDDDVIYAGTGNDYVEAGYGDDEVYAGNGADLVLGENGNDFIEGGAGDDKLHGDASNVSLADQGDDYIDGGAGNDTIVGYGGNDQLFGGDGNDNLNGDDANLELSAHGDDYLDGEAGDDILYGQGGNDELFGGDGLDLLDGGQGDDYLDGEAGNDTLSGAAGSDELFGDEGDDFLHGDAANVAEADQGADYIDGEAGNDYIVGYGGDDSLYGSDGLDTIYGGAGDDIIDGGDGDNSLYGEAGNNEIYAGTGNDLIVTDAGLDYMDAGDGNNSVFGGASDDTIFAGSGNDWLQGDEGNDYLYGGAGNNSLLGGEGNDELFGGAEVDILQGDAGDDYLEGFEGNDLLMGVDGNDTLFGDEGNDSLQGDAGNDYLDGGAGDDSMLGMDGNDEIYGGDGVDTIWGGTGDDTIYGGAGNDNLLGEGGGDIYQFGRGDGVDTIENYATDYASTTDTVQFGEDITISNLEFIRTGDDLQINIKETLDLLIIRNWYLGPDSKPDQFTFADSTVMTAAQIDALGLSSRYGTEGNDTLFGSSLDDEIYGMSGNDTINGYNGNDLLDGGAGNDSINGGNGMDTIFGGAGMDMMYGGNGDDIYYLDNLGDGVGENSGEGIDTIYSSVSWTINANFEYIVLTGSEHISATGNALDNIFTGNSGSNVFSGGAGNDTYHYGIGSNVDVIANYSGDYATTTDTVQFGAGIVSEDLVLVRQMYDLRINITGTEDILIVRGWFYDDAYKIDQFIFADQTILTAAQLEARGYTVSYDIDGTPGNDSLRGTDSDEHIYGYGGDDSLYGDVDYVYISGGNDTLAGGPGNDYLEGDAGDDIYVFNRGDGLDTIYNYTTDWDQFYPEDAVRFGEGITLADLDVLRSGDDLLINIKGTTDTVTITDYFIITNFVTGPYKVGRFEFADGTVLDQAQFEGLTIHLTHYGTDGNDTIEGSYAGDTIYGYGGNDILGRWGGNDALYGGDGDDTLRSGSILDSDSILDGGAGNDSLIGSDNGNNTYVFGHGYGQDVIDGESEYYVNDEDFINFDESVQEAEVTFARNEAALIISINGSSDTLTVQSWFTGYNSIAGIRFSNGTLWDIGTINQMYSQATAGDDQLFGSNGADMLTALSGNDTIYGYGGDDTIDGGAGDDFIMGGIGDDTYLFGIGSGQDYISDHDQTNGNLDTVRLGSGITPDNLSLRMDESYTAMILSITGATDTLTLNYWLSSSDAIERIIFDNGTVWDVETINNILALQGTEGDDTLTGFATADKMSGFAGNDEIYGLAGDDTLDGGAGIDTLYGGSDNDTYIRDNASDIIMENAGEGTDTVQSSVTYTLPENVENLVLTGTSAINGTGNVLDNYLTGNSKVNTLTGNAGNDTIDGAAGNDSLVGGAGNDSYFFARGYGQDTINDNDSTSGNLDKIMLAADIAPADVTLRRSGDNLIASINNTTDTVTVQNWFVSGGANRVEQIVFEGGTIWDEAYIQANATMGGTSGNDSLTGTSGADLLSGLAGNDTLTGLAGDDTLDGGTGADSMVGGAGNDTYIRDNTSDVITEGSGAGTDTVLSNLTYTLVSNVENLTLTGTNAINGTGNTLANYLIGNSAVNTLTGSSGNDTLDGGAGADSLVGGTNDDTYIVDNTGDKVTESSGAGTDTVLSSVTYTLSTNVEHLTLTGTADINGTGNSSANRITGNSGNNILSGGSGADTMIGGAGNDTYVRDNTGDVITENADEGIDTVQTNLTYTLATNVENLTLTGSSTISGTGNTLDNYLTGNSAVNTLTGNAGNDTLNGGAGADSLVGGAGDDTYIVDNTSDKVTESSGAGTDTVQSLVTFTIGSNVENLTLTGTSAINGTGNDLANTLTGNSGVNTLTGNAENDTLDGGAGNDSLVGGAGNDTYIFRIGSGQDSVNNNDTTTGRTDTIRFEDVSSTGLSSVSRSGNDLVLTYGSGDTVTIKNDYSGTAYQVNQFTFSDGVTYTRDQLLSAYGLSGMLAAPRTISAEADDIIIDTLHSSTGKFQTRGLHMETVTSDRTDDFMKDWLADIKAQCQRQKNQFERLAVTDGRYVNRQDIENIVNIMNTINGNAGIDSIKNFNAMMAEQTYNAILTNTWRQI